MTTSTAIAPVFSIIFISGRDVGEPPEYVPEQVAFANPTCITVCTLCEMDGKTTIVLSDEPRYGTPWFVLHRTFAGILNETGGEVNVYTAELDRLLSLPVASESVAIEVWVNSSSEPTLVHIYVDSRGSIETL